jgi:hypothetical protein
MTWILRNTFLALVAFATLAIVVMMAMTLEAKDWTAGAGGGDAPSGVQANVR